MNIGFISKKYLKEQFLNRLDLELIIASVLEKSREFVLTHLEFTLSQPQIRKIGILVKKRQKGIPLAYLIGKKEFFGLEFKVDKNILIPRPETEILVEEALKLLKTKNYQLKTKIIDIGTGSGNIIISTAYNIEHGTYNNNISYFATDVSSPALKIAKLNSQGHKLDKKIKFLKGNLLEPIMNNKKCFMFNDPCSMIIIANLPYVSQVNYKKYHSGIKFEPRGALLSKNCGLLHYEKLFQQIKKMFVPCSMLCISCILEFSPEQKNKINTLAKKYFPRARIIFKKDLAGKWRLAIIHF
jgi:release factor glutamine methyltransferase